MSDNTFGEQVSMAEEVKAPLKRLAVSDQAGELRERLRSIPLAERLAQIPDRISKMCAQGQPPRMSIPVQWNDDDWFITYTVKDALAAISARPTADIAVLAEEAGRQIIDRLNGEIAHCVPARLLFDAVDDLPGIVKIILSVFTRENTLVKQEEKEKS